MSKMKYSKDVMLWAIQVITNGELSVSDCAKKIGCHKTAIRCWIAKYNAFGESSLNNLKGNSHYTKEVRTNAVLDYLKGLSSLRDICIKYKISSHSVLLKWIMWYNEGKELSDYTPNRGIYHMKSRKTTKKEKQEIVKFCIDNEFNYTLTAQKFAVPYMQVYQWVKRFKSGGNEALVDNRGRTKPIGELTELELLKQELETTKRVLMLSEIENEVLKKKEEIELRLLSPKRGKK